MVYWFSHGYICFLPLKGKSPHPLSDLKVLYCTEYLTTFEISYTNYLRGNECLLLLTFELCRYKIVVKMLNIKYVAASHVEYLSSWISIYSININNIGWKEGRREGGKKR